MSKTKKILLTIVLAVILIFAYTVNVSAVTMDNGANLYDLDYLFTYAPISCSLSPNDHFEVGGLLLVGPSGIITLNSGTITIASEKVDDSKLNLTIELNGDAVVNASQLANLDNDLIAKLEIIIDTSSTLTINGTLVIPSINGNNSITNNGTITISDGGELEVRKSATYNGSGTVNVYGTLAIFGTNFTTTGSVNLYEGGEIYSYIDVANSITVPADEEGYTYSLVSDTGIYNSTATSNTSISNANVYTLSKVVVEGTPDIGGDDPITDDTVVGGSTTGDDGTTETTVVDDEEAIEEATEEETTEAETTSNPTTGDAIMVFAVVFVVAIAGIVVTIKMRKRTK